ncbi:MAG: hypothetical protein ACTSWN_11480 [Promethearchaeota archaeon]
MDLKKCNCIFLINLSLICISCWISGLPLGFMGDSGYRDLGFPSPSASINETEVIGNYEAAWNRFIYCLGLAQDINTEIYPNNTDISQQLDNVRELLENANRSIEVDDYASANDYITDANEIMDELEPVIKDRIESGEKQLVLRYVVFILGAGALVFIIVLGAFLFKRHESRSLRKQLDVEIDYSRLEDEGFKDEIDT